MVERGTAMRYFTVKRLLLLALCLLLTACSTVDPIVQKDGFVILPFSTMAEVQEACDRLSDAVLVPLGGCYSPWRDLAIIIRDGTSSRHEVCHHYTMHHLMLTPEASEAYCTRR